MKECCNIEDMVGCAVVRYELDDDKTKLTFHTRTGWIFEMYHEQDCCESVSIDDIEGELDDLLDTMIIKAEEASNPDPDASESGTWTFYRFVTFKGRVTIRWYGSSNGYYSESVNVYKTIPNGEEK